MGKKKYKTSRRAMNLAKKGVGSDFMDCLILMGIGMKYPNHNNILHLIEAKQYRNLEMEMIEE